jgi:non-ribosomal peptide synthetase component F
MNIMIDETFRMYEEYLGGQKANLPSLPIQYKDYSVWHNATLSSKRAEKARQYWLKKLSGEMPSCTLTADYPGNTAHVHNGATSNALFSADETGRIEEFSRDNGVSLFVTLLSVVKVLIYRYTYQNDIVVGTPAAGREHVDLHNQIGFFVNTLVLRNSISGDDVFREVLRRVHHTAIDAFENQVYPYDLLVDEVMVNREKNRSSLFDIMVMLQNNTVSEMGSGIMQVTDNPPEASTSKFDLLFNFFVENNQLNLELEYNTGLYEAERIDGVISNFRNLIGSILLQPNEQVDNLAMMEVEEQANFFL